MVAEEAGLGEVRHGCPVLFNKDSSDSRRLDCNGNGNRVFRKQGRESISPFHEADTVGNEIVREPELVDLLRVFEAIEIEVVNRGSSWIGLGQGIAWAGDCGVAEVPKKPSDKGRLSRP